MKRNGGIIGPNREPSPNSTIGIYDLYDQYNSTFYDLWTRSAGYNSITYERGAQVFEGDTLVFNVSTVGVSNNTRVYWFVFNISGVTGGDFVGGALSGSFLINNNLGSFSITISQDGVAELGNQFRVQLRESNNINAAVVLQTGVIEILEPGATVSGPTQANEGTPVTFIINTVDFPFGSLSWQLEWIQGLQTTTDVDINAGTVEIVNGVGSVTVNLSADGFTEGTEAFRLVIFNSTGTSIGASPLCYIQDTSTGSTEQQTNTTIRVLYIANDYTSLYSTMAQKLKTQNDILASAEPNFYSAQTTFTVFGKENAWDLDQSYSDQGYDCLIWSNNYTGSVNTYQTILNFLNANKGVVWLNFGHTYWSNGYWPQYNVYAYIGPQWQITASGGWNSGNSYGAVSGITGIMRGVTEQRDQGYLANGFVPVNGGQYADESNTNTTYRLAIYKDYGFQSRRVDINAWIGGTWDNDPTITNGILRCVVNSCYWAAKKFL